jgi:protein-tyrosine phosphatase
MVDIHCHILPSVDDGAQDWDDCLEMARIAVADGIETICATPHWPGDESGSTKSHNVRVLTRAVQDRLDEEQIPLRVVPGHELVILPDLPEELSTGGALTLGDGVISRASADPRATARYALLEMPYQPLPFFLRDIVFQVQSRGITPVLAHPERNPTVQGKPEVLGEYVEAGCILQVSAGSILGQFGQTAHRAAQALMRSGWCHVIASDAHSPRNRPPRLAAARDEAARTIGAIMAERAVAEIPASILHGLPLDLLSLPVPPPRRTFFQRLLGAR